MADDFRVTGANDFLKLSKSLKAAGRGDLRKELNKGLRTAAKPLIPVLREELEEVYPKKGGLADRMRKTSARVAVRTGKDPGVSIVFVGITVKVGELTGTWRHPVFGNRDAWAAQTRPQVKGALATKAGANVSKVKDGLELAIQSVADKVASGG